MSWWQILLFSYLLACCLGFPRCVRHPDPSSWLGYNTLYADRSRRHDGATLQVATTPIPSSEKGKKEKDEYLRSIIYTKNAVTPPLLPWNDTSLGNILPLTVPTATTSTAASTKSRSSTREIIKSATSQVRSINKQINVYFGTINNLHDSSNAYDSRIEEIASELKSYLDSNREYLDRVHVLTVMYKCSKLGRSDLASFIDLNLVVSTLNSAEKKPVQFRSVATALYSLHAMNTHTNISSKNDMYRLFMKDIVSIVTRWLVDMRARGDQTQLTGQAIAMSVVGLKHLDIHTEEVKLMMKELISLIKSRKTSMSAHDVASALYGMQSIDCSVHEEADFLLQQIVDMMEDSADFRGDKRLSPKHFSMILYGLHSSSSNSR